MNIAIIAGIFPKISEKFILNHVTGLIELGHEVEVFSILERPAHEKMHEGVFEYGILEKTYYFNIPEQRLYRILLALRLILIKFWRYPRELGECLDLRRYSIYEALNNIFKAVPFLGKNFDVIHCHFGPNANEFVFLKRVFKNVKFFVTFHGFDIRRGLKDGGGMYRDLFVLADEVCVTCQYGKEMLRRLGCPEQKLMVVPNGVNCVQFSTVARPGGPKVVMTTVARLVSEKNIPFALHVVRALLDNGIPNLEYVIVGDGDRRGEIEAAIDELHLKDTVQLRGALTEAETIDVLRQTDIFFLPSVEETFGVVLLEAQAMGIPVVATDVGGVKEAIRDNVTGYLVPLGDVAVAQAKIEALIKDRPLRERMGAAGRKFVEENFNITQIIARLAQTYGMPGARQVKVDGCRKWRDTWQTQIR